MEKNLESPIISSKTAKQAQSDIKAILRQIFRFKKMPFNECKAYFQKHPKEIFFRIPHPDGKGLLLCGAIGWNKLEKLTDLTLDLDRGLGRRVGRERARSAVTDAFVERILREAREVTHDTAEVILQDALAALRKSLIITEHFLPSVLFTKYAPTEFRIGPVTFVRRKNFFGDRKQAFKHSIEAAIVANMERVNEAVAQGFPRERASSEAQARRHIRGLQAQAIKTYRNYPWIAVVKVTDCDKDTSKERAVRAVEMALHLIRIILGAEPTRELRHAWSHSNALRTAHLHTDADGIIHASVGFSFLAPISPTNWHEVLMGASDELTVLGWALESIVDPVEISHLHQRLLDAINWFGDAATDSQITSSVIKYVSAIERLLFGNFESGRTKMFANRVKSIFEAFDCDNDGCVYEQALEVYKARSALVHGEHFPSEDETHKILRTAEALSRMCLICSAQLYPMMARAFNRPDSAKLEETMKRITSEGLAWLAEASGFSRTRRSQT